VNSPAPENFLDRIFSVFTEGDPHVVNKPTEEANVCRVQRMYAAVMAGNFDALLDAFAEDVELEIIGPSAILISGRWRGREEAGIALRRNFSHFEDQRPEVQTVVAQGETVVISAHETGRFRATGRTYDIHWVQFFTFRAGQLIRFREMVDTTALLEGMRTKRE
jgi:ketosteroid isomerase-like protein